MLCQRNKWTEKWHEHNLYFYVCSSVHRWYILITVQWHATQSSLFTILQVHSTCFACQPHPSSGVHKTSLQHGQAWQHCRKVSGQKIWPVPETVITVLCTPDDGCGWHPKHVAWTCRIINRLLCVASRWTFSNKKVFTCATCAVSTSWVSNP
jgi:hypothetical protein